MFVPRSDSPVPADPHPTLPLARFLGVILSDYHISRDDYSSVRDDLSCLGRESWVAKGQASLYPIQYRDAWADYYAIHGGAWRCSACHPAGAVGLEPFNIVLYQNIVNIMTQLPLAFEHANAHNSSQFLFPTRRGDYLVQVSWPLCWSEERIPPEHDSGKSVSTIYAVDGNAYFFTATDIVRRLEFTNHTRTIIVAIGYPNKTCVFDKRRTGDLTIPSSTGAYDIPPGPDGKPSLGPFGEADDFLDVIRNDIAPYVDETLFPNAPVNSGPRALFGHSYGGLFTLNALFTKPDAFDTFIAASPSIWFNHESIVREQEARFHEREPPTDKAPRLLVMFGGAEQTLIRQPGDSDETFNRKQKWAAERRMKDNALELAARMGESPNVRGVWQWEFEGEDHGGAAPCALQRGLVRFLLDQKLES